MSEYVREAYISLYIDTNKRTVEKWFNTVEELRDYLEEHEYRSMLGDLEQAE